MTRTGINPTQAQIGEIAGSDVTGEIVMLNLLRFSDAPQEYGRYEEIASRHLAKAGARITWIGAARHLVIGDPDTDTWDAVALVAYPRARRSWKWSPPPPTARHLSTANAGWPVPS